MEQVEKLAAFMAYCTSEKNEETTIGSKFVAVNFYHMQYDKGMKLPLDSLYIKGVRQGIKRKQVEAGAEQRMRGPLTSGMLTEMQQEVRKRGDEGKVLWIGLALTYLLMLRSEELYGRERVRVYEVHCLQGEDVASSKEMSS